MKWTIGLATFPTKVFGTRTNSPIKVLNCAANTITLTITIKRTRQAASRTGRRKKLSGIRAFKVDPSRCDPSTVPGGVKNPNKSWLERSVSRLFDPGVAVASLDDAKLRVSVKKGSRSASLVGKARKPPGPRLADDILNEKSVKTAYARYARDRVQLERCSIIRNNFYGLRRGNRFHISANRERSRSGNGERIKSQKNSPMYTRAITEESKESHKQVKYCEIFFHLIN